VAVCAILIALIPIREVTLYPLCWRASSAVVG